MEAFVGTLTCPYCRSHLEVLERVPSSGTTFETGIARCSCYEYPIVDGVIVLRQTSGPADTEDPAVAALRRNDVTAARTRLEQAGSMVATDGPAPSRRAELARRVRDVVERRRRGRGPATAIEGDTALQQDLRAARPRGFADYLYLRYANPSFAAAVPLLAALEVVDATDRRPRVLDLACGIGHSTAMLRALFPEWCIVAMEPDFVNLQLLHRHFDQRALRICADAEVPLPFEDGTFDAVVCLDAFHYIRSKWALAGEMQRVVRDDGVVVLPHLHNAAATNPAPGIPLAGPDYQRLFERLPNVLLDERAVLEQFAEAGRVELPRPGDAWPGAGATAFGLVATKRSDAWRTVEPLRRLVDLADPSDIGPNPLYRTTASPDGVRLERHWPDQLLARECATMERYLPAETVLDGPFLQRVRDGSATAEDRSRLLELMRSFVLVHLPAGYRRPPVDR